MQATRRHSVRMLPSAVAGIEVVVAESDRHFSRHTHDQFGMGVIERGAQVSASGRGPVEAGMGDVITVNPGEVHDGAPIGDNGRLWRMVYLDPEIIFAVGRDVTEGRKFFVEFTDPVIRNAAAAREVHRLFAAVTASNGSASQLLGHELLLSLVATLIREKVGPPTLPAWISRARERIDDDPAQAVTLAELAQLSGLSQFQLLRAFSRATGLTPHAYLVQKRIALARRLIAGGVPLAEAAATSGFSDQSHMTRIFTRAFGFSPRIFAMFVRGTPNPRHKILI